MERGYTLSLKHKLTYIWRINEMSSFIASSSKAVRDKILYSPEFSTGAKIGDIWELQLKCSNPQVNDLKDYISLFLSLKIAVEIQAEVSLFILNIFNLRVNELKFNENYTPTGLSWGFERFFEKQYLLKNKNTIMPGDILAIGADISVLDNHILVPSTIPSGIRMLSYSCLSMADDYADLFKTKIGSDVVLIVNGRSFDAHKTVLMARSSVFSAMLISNMKEKKENVINIPNINPEIFNSLLEFIYTDKVTNLDNIAEELIELADKYLLESLKMKCAQALCKFLRIDNAARFFVLADRYNIKTMFEYVAEFIAVYAEEVIKTPEYQMMKRSDPSLT
ncbi:hypothetical protein KQX54_012545 [Cotesia glomerata]|uniref:Uncharacterized protein n=1 Tax=Cotesia glomerata TaxID=32391 RepID=A0AAV7IUU0_COTGL|nr:hypothetical protein KQX54_012545 [Cotesia glomerata]